MGDGDGWIRCALGHRHWGRFGAAGLLVTDGARVLLQHRSAWTHNGDTWAVPGGARDSHEDALAAAVREAAEETNLDASLVEPFAQVVDEHGGWAYTTIVARAAAGLEVRATNAESIAVRWWALEEVADLALHHGFARTWPQLFGLVRG